jgi:hypothetical protein
LAVVWTARWPGLYRYTRLGIKWLAAEVKRLYFCSATFLAAQPHKTSMMHPAHPLFNHLPNSLVLRSYAYVRPCFDFSSLLAPQLGSPGTNSPLFLGSLDIGYPHLISRLDTAAHLSPLSSLLVLTGFSMLHKLITWAIVFVDLG